MSTCQNVTTRVEPIAPLSYVASFPKAEKRCKQRAAVSNLVTLSRHQLLKLKLLRDAMIEPLPSAIRPDQGCPRPATPFRVFMAARRKILIRKNPRVKFAEIREVAERLWPGLDPADRELYVKRSAEINVLLHSQLVQRLRDHVEVIEHHQEDDQEDVEDRQEEDLSSLDRSVIGLDLFFEERHYLLLQDPNKERSFTEMFNGVLERWSGLGESSRKVYQSRADQVNRANAEQSSSSSVPSEAVPGFSTFRTRHSGSDGSRPLDFADLSGIWNILDPEQRTHWRCLEIFEKVAGTSSLQAGNLLKIQVGNV